MQENNNYVNRVLINLVFVLQYFRNWFWSKAPFQFSNWSPTLIPGTFYEFSEKWKWTVMEWLLCARYYAMYGPINHLVQAVKNEDTEVWEARELAGVCIASK